jgi:hypothetical protein
VIRAFLFLAALNLTTISAWAEETDLPAESGVGEAPRYSTLYDGDFRDLLDDARAPAIEALGEDAVRFSSQPALGGTGYMFVLRATGDVEITWFRGHPGLGWRRTRRERFQIPEPEYGRITAEVDRLMSLGVAEAQGRANNEGGRVLMVCSDGPGYLTERVRDGGVMWLRPMCSGTNADIAAYLTSWSFKYLGR